MFSRTLRSETRNRGKDELKRAINSLEKVRKWEKKWIVVKDTTMKIFKWVLVAGDTSSKGAVRKSLNPLTAVADTASTNAEDEDASRTETVPNGSMDNSRETESETTTNRLRVNFELNEDSNTEFSENGFDSDSNQAFDATRYQPGGDGSTDFSEMRRAEMDEDSREPAAKRLKEM